MCFPHDDEIRNTFDKANDVAHDVICLSDDLKSTNQSNQNCEAADN